MSEEWDPSGGQFGARNLSSLFPRFGPDSADDEQLGLPFTDDAKEIVLRLDAGLALFVTKHIVPNVGVDYSIPGKDLEDLNYISVGWGVP